MLTWSRTRCCVALPLAAALLAGCSGGGSTPDTAPPTTPPATADAAKDVTAGAGAGAWRASRRHMAGPDASGIEHAAAGGTALCKACACPTGVAGGDDAQRLCGEHSRGHPGSLFRRGHRTVSGSVLAAHRGETQWPAPRSEGKGLDPGRLPDRDWSLGDRLPVCS